MKRYERLLLVLFVLLLGGAAAGWVLTRPAPANPAAQGNRAGASTQSTVDQGAFTIAQQLAPLAGSDAERNLARLALSLSDQELDLAFASALRQATAHPVALSARAQRAQQHVTEVEATVTADQAETARLNASLTHAVGANKDKLTQELQLQQAQQALEEDELADAKQDLARAGGDPQGDIRRQMDEHAALEGHNGAASAAPDTTTGSTGSNQSGDSDLIPMMPMAAPATTFDYSSSHSVLGLTILWRQLRATSLQLLAAQQDAQLRTANLTASHEQLDQQVGNEDQKRATLSQQAAQAMTTGGQTAAQAAADALGSVHQQASDQKTLADYDKRIQTMQRLSNVYGRWNDQVSLRTRATLHSLAWDSAWIFVIALIALLTEVMLNKIFIRIQPERKRLHTVRTVVRFIVRVVGAIAILLVIFGLPNNFATVVALAGAGLTVALKDFIVGFFGWFILLGNNGIRAGDWVEINGVTGEVLEVGLFHTVLLERGEWPGGSAPTGRKVTFVNSFAIEGHYFNFTTSHRWVWDELQVAVPSGIDPFTMGEGIQALVIRETQDNVKRAEQDWQKVSDSHHQPFSAAPVLNVKPDGSGAVVSVRYLTVENERHALSARLYRDIFQMLREQAAPENQVTHGAGMVSGKPS